MSLQAYKRIDVSTNKWEAVALDDYKEAISYDPNGNILTYNRQGAPEKGMQLKMDDLQYNYYATTNRLKQVTDNPAYSSYYTEDIDNQSNTSNYTYDAIGNLKTDVSEGITNINWTVYGKIDTIAKSSGNIRYTYDAGGNRITKLVGNNLTVYVRDAQGNVMSVYEKLFREDTRQIELHLYGSSRLGLLGELTTAPSTVTLSGGYDPAILSTFTRGEKFFELSNHLGNVLATITDKKLQHDDGSGGVDYYNADVATANDYYPGGMLMPGRTYTSGNGYRYSINGQEKTPEIAPNTTTAEFWQYDARIVRRWNADPVLKEYESPYLAFGGNPIWLMDRNGADTTFPVAGSQGAEFTSLPNGVTNIDVYNNNDYYLKGTKKRVIVGNGELRSFTYSGLGTFSAHWYPNEGEVSPSFAGYKNEEGLTFNEAVAKYNAKINYENFVTKVNSWLRDPINQVSLIALPLSITQANFKSGNLRAGNPSVVLKTEFEAVVKSELKSALTAETGSSTIAPYWPSKEGALGEWYDVFAIKGAKVDRIGGLGGSYLAPFGTPFEMRALPANGIYRAFEVLKPFPMQASITAPWFGKIGLGTQYKTPISINELIVLKYLKPL